MHRGETDFGELYDVAKDPWEMNNLYNDPGCREIREALRRKLFDWTLMTSRHGNLHPPTLPGADGKSTLAELKKLLDNGNVNYL